MRGYLLAASAGILWGLISLFGRLMVNYRVDPAAIMSVRAIIAFASLALGLLILRPKSLRIGWNDVPFFAAVGLFGMAASYLLYLYALTYTTSATAIVVVYTYPALVSIAAAVLFGERLGKSKIAAIVLALAGSFLVAQAYRPAALQVNGIGVLFAAGTAVALAFYTLATKGAIKKYDSWTLTLYGIGFAAIWLTIIASPAAVVSVRLPALGWAVLLGWAWVPTILAYALYLMSLKYIEASRASIICTLEPVSAIALTSVFMGEVVTLPQLCGAMLVLLGVVLIGWEAAARQSARRQAADAIPAGERLH